MTRDATLSQALLPNQTLLTKLGLVLAGSFLVALGAQAEVPMFPVPMTLQTLAISVVGLTFGARLAGLTLLAYLAEGAMGLPVYSGGGAGVAHLVGPTGGYLFGFVAMAWMTGWLAEHGFGRGFIRMSLAALIPSMLLFVPGVAWLWYITPLDLNGAIAAGATPFLVGGLVKSVVAAMVAAGGWEALVRRRS
ncbi:MAG: biotin transporter BioY [Rhodobacteraceae bacterium]|nr:biotin transporter BioY [Paracoccaceae bacterium]